MNTGLIILGLLGTGVIFGIAAYLSPRVIKALFPNTSETMLRWNKVMLVLALITVVLAIGSVLFMQFLN